MSNETPNTVNCAPNLEMLKLELERTRYRVDIAKWAIAALGAIISFLVIDYGKLKLEKQRYASESNLAQQRFVSESRRSTLEAYLKATEAAEPDVWKRKLHVLHKFSGDTQTAAWAETELRYVEQYSALNVLYHEAVHVAAQLSERRMLNSPERRQARIRFNELYWADLPFAGESSDVVKAMFAFREALVRAESAPNDAKVWFQLNGELISLSATLRDEAPKWSQAR